MTLEQVRDGVRRQSFFGVMMAIVSSMLVVRTERGDEMFLTMLDRHSSHVLDTGALDVLPAAREKPSAATGSGRRGGAHPGDEPLWNESWYWDFADPEQGIGGWIRLGLMPNQNVAWINALICGPDIPTVALLDFHAPLPADPNDVCRQGDSNCGTAQRNRCRSYRVGVERPGAGPTTTRRPCCAASRAGRPTWRWI